MKFVQRNTNLASKLTDLRLLLLASMPGKTQAVDINLKEIEEVNIFKNYNRFSYQF